MSCVRIIQMKVLQAKIFLDLYLKNGKTRQSFTDSKNGSEQDTASPVNLQ